MGGGTETKAVHVPQLAREMAEALGISAAAAKRAIDGLRGIVVAHLLRCERVAIAGIGAIEARPTPERRGRNPRTGEALIVPAGHRVAFRPAHGLKRRARGIGTGPPPQGPA